MLEAKENARTENQPFEEEQEVMEHSRISGRIPKKADFLLLSSIDDSYSLPNVPWEIITNYSKKY